ncbi:hypothetical protein ACIBF1_08475 [Spirillospora sp. NPDC050679]
MRMTRTLTDAARDEMRRRQEALSRLQWELRHAGVRTRLSRRRNGRWRLAVLMPGWTEKVMCAGAEDFYSYVTAHGRLLGPADDVRHVAQTLALMVERRRR